MKVRLTETAFGDLHDIYDYIAIENPRAASAVVARIDETIRRIGMFPSIGPQKYRSARMFPVGRFPYLIFYTVEADEVVILTIRHAARRRPFDNEI